MTRNLLLGSVAALLMTAPAHAATKTLTADRAVKRDCTSGLMIGKAGVATAKYTAPLEGTVTAHLRGGSRSGDWDLAAYDSAGKLIQGSSAFEANEVVDVNLRAGARITLQACRNSGRDASVPLAIGFSEFDFESLIQSGPVSAAEVHFTEGWQLRALESLGLDVTHDIHDGHARVMLYGDEDRKILSRTGLEFRPVVGDALAAERAARKADRLWAQRIGNRSTLPSGRTEYRTYDDVQQELKDMAAQFPQLVRPFTFKTKTYQGRDIQALEIAQDANSSDDTRPVLYLNGIHHAREWPATEVIMEFAWDLLKNHGKDPLLAQVLRDVRVVVQPYTNIDGFLVSRQALGQPEDVESNEGVLYGTATGVVILGGSFGYKRKNCNPYPQADAGQPCEINIGTDNNRNYPHTWGGTGASTNPNDQSYRGIGPGSEPETHAVQEFSLQTNQTVLLSMHNIAAKVLRPPGTEAEGKAPDEDGLAELGRRIAEPAGYANEYGFQLYDVTGGTKDWAYAVTGSFAYTVETGPANGDFHGPYEEVVVNQYTGEDLEGRGMREAFINSALWTREEKYNSRIAGRAPAGRTLRISKETITLTSPVCAVAGIIPLSTTQSTPDECVAPGDVIEVPEKIDVTTTVPDSGRFTWWVNPSSRPYAKAPEAYKLTCEQDGKVMQQMDIVVARGQTLDVDLPCGGTLPGGNGGGGAGDALKLSVGKVKAKGKAIKAKLKVTGGTASKVRILVRKGRKTVARKTVKSLAGTKTIKVKAKRRLKRGKYTLRVSAKGARTVTRKFRAR